MGMRILILFVSLFGLSSQALATGGMASCNYRCTAQCINAADIPSCLAWCMSSCRESCEKCHPGGANMSAPLSEQGHFRLFDINYEASQCPRHNSSALNSASGTARIKSVYGALEYSACTGRIPTNLQ